MAILINDMDLPETCEDCRFHQYHSRNEYVCIATPLLYPWNLANYKDGRKDFCPLKSADEMLSNVENVETDGDAWELALRDEIIEIIRKYVENNHANRLDIKGKG